MVEGWGLVDKKLLLFGVCIMLCVSFASATIDLSYKLEDNQNTAETTDNDVTIGANDKLVVVCIMTDTNYDPVSTTPTFNGNDMTRAGLSLGDTGGEGTTDVFYMIEPPTGTSTLTVTEATSNTDYSIIITTYNVTSPNT